MLQKIFVTNANNDDLAPLTLMEPEESGFIILNIDGLGPSKSNINVREKAQSSGSAFNSARTSSRNIVFTIQFLENPTIEVSRLLSYRYFPNETRVRLDFVTDAGTFYIYGYVESNEPNIFSEKEGTVVSIICPDPFFRKLNHTVESGTIVSVTKLFEFEFWNDTDTNPKNIVFGEMSFDQLTFEIVNEGTVAIGPTITIKAEGGEITDPEIHFFSEDDSSVVEELKFSFTASLPHLEDGDTLVIVCENQNKSVYRYSGTQRINYLGTVTLDSSWPTLRPAVNTFSYNASVGAEFIRLSYEYSPKYIGI